MAQGQIGAERTGVPKVEGSPVGPRPAAKKRPNSRGVSYFQLAQHHKGHRSFSPSIPHRVHPEGGPSCKAAVFRRLGPAGVGGGSPTGTLSRPNSGPDRQAQEATRAKNWHGVPAAGTGHFRCGSATVIHDLYYHTPWADVLRRSSCQ